MRKDPHSDSAASKPDAEQAGLERERLLVQTREANERLVIATLKADELVDEARASNRAKDQFLAMLAHELRNPLAPILIALDLIAMDTGDTHRREHAIVERQVKQLVQLVDELLDIARIRSGKIELHRQPVELAKVVSRSVEIASPVIESKHHALSVDVPDGLVVDGDLLRLTQVVGNLLTNAAKYTPPGGSITVTAERHGPIVTLRVRDTGIGISQDMLPRIFEPFTQEQQPSDRAADGLGLGLAIVRSLVELHGGTVTAHSEGLGRGTELSIELPVPTRGVGTAVPGGPPAAVVARAAPRKVLVVDDNRLVAELTSLALGKVGYEARTAFDGPSAISIAKDYAPDVVLLDIGLPGMDGYELAERLRAILPSQDIHFIAITGYGQAADRRQSADASFDEHLVKPVDLATLQRSIEATRRSGPR